MIIDQDIHQQSISLFYSFWYRWATCLWEKAAALILYSVEQPCPGSCCSASALIRPEKSFQGLPQYNWRCCSCCFGQLQLMLVWAIRYSSPTQFWELCIHTFNPNSHIPGSKPRIQIFFPAFNINFGSQSYASRVEDPLCSPFRGAGAEEVSGRDSRQAASWGQGEGIIHRITDVTDKKNLQKTHLTHPSHLAM